MAKQADAPVAERAETAAAWRRLWGSSGARSPRQEPGGMQAFSPQKWELERLIIGRDAPGADLQKLGIKRKK
jgi:hypothetical protein